MRNEGKGITAEHGAAKAEDKDSPKCAAHENEERTELIKKKAEKGRAKRSPLPTNGNH